jgi:multiple antibiotic resistance protein
MIGPGEIFTLFFVTLGPEKVIGPFAQQTRALEPAALRGRAARIRALAVRCGSGRLFRPPPRASLAHLDAGAADFNGVIFFLVALRSCSRSTEPPRDAAPPPLPAEPMAAALKLTFPTVVTPYGIAGLIVLLAATADTVREEMIFGTLLVVMVLNLLAMLFARAIVQGALLLALRLLGAVLGVMQVALAMQIMLQGLESLGIVPAAK